MSIWKQVGWNFAEPRGRSIADERQASDPAEDLALLARLQIDPGACHRGYRLRHRHAGLRGGEDRPTGACRRYFGGDAARPRAGQKDRPHQPIAAHQAGSSATRSMMDRSTSSPAVRAPSLPDRGRASPCARGTGVEARRPAVPARRGVSCDPAEVPEVAGRLDRWMRATQLCPRRSRPPYPRRVQHLVPWVAGPHRTRRISHRRRWQADLCGIIWRRG